MVKERRAETSGTRGKGVPGSRRAEIRDGSDDRTASRLMSGKTVMGAALGGLVVLQVVLLIVTLSNRNDLRDLRAEVEAGSGLSSGIPNLGSGGLSSPGPTSSAAPVSSVPVAGNLPRFLGGGVDSAIGRNLGDVTALEYYSGQTTRLAASDGKARAYMVWAHWCPFCQDELPVMADWQAAQASDLAGFEMVSVTTAMDETASNPLVPYLDENQFPFPVLFDEDGSIAQKLGVNAFPFWVFVAPDGTVVGRAAGFIEPENLTTVFEQLNAMAVDGTDRG